MVLVMIGEAFTPAFKVEGAQCSTCSGEALQCCAEAVEGAVVQEPLLTLTLNLRNVSFVVRIAAELSASSSKPFSQLVLHFDSQDAGISGSHDRVSQDRYFISAPAIVTALIDDCRFINRENRVPHYQRLFQNNDGVRQWRKVSSMSSWLILQPPHRPDRRGLSAACGQNNSSKRRNSLIRVDF